MIDRIALRVPNVIGVPELEWAFESTQRKGGWARTSRGVESPLVRVSVSKAKAGHDVRIEANMAKLVLGHNARPLSIGELRAAAVRLEGHVLEALEGAILPRVEAWEIVSAELLHDWVVDLPSAYVIEVYRVAEQRRGHRRNLFTTAGQGGGYTFSFGPKRGWVGRLYDKQAEVECLLKGRAGAKVPTQVAEEMRRLARGRLRYEAVADAKSMATWLRKPRPTLIGLLDDLGQDPYGYVATEWNSLVRRWEPTEYASAIALLRRAYPAARAQRLFDAWVHVRSVGEEQYRSLFEVHRATWSRLVGDLRKAGLQTGTPLPLERLEIHRAAEDD